MIFFREFLQSPCINHMETLDAETKVKLKAILYDKSFQEGPVTFKLLLFFHFIWFLQKFSSVFFKEMIIIDFSGIVLFLLTIWFMEKILYFFIQYSQSVILSFIFVFACFCLEFLYRFQQLKPYLGSQCT